MYYLTTARTPTPERSVTPPRHGRNTPEGLTEVPVRIHINLDDMPEFESFTSMWTAVRGTHWSITNTPLGEDLTDDQRDKLLTAIGQLEDALKPLAEIEDGWIAKRRKKKEDFLLGSLTTDSGSITPP